MNAARWTAAALAAVIVAAAVVALVPRKADAVSAGSDGPRGMSSLLEAAEEATGEGASLVTSTPLALRGDARIDPKATLLVVTGATRPYTSEEADALEAFLRDGGRALVAEQDGQAGSLVARYGVSFERTPVIHPAGDVPVSFTAGTGPHEVAARLPTPLVVAPGAEVEVLAQTAPDAFVDRDGDGEFSRADPAGPFAVAARALVGGNGGEVWVLGSLDLLSNRLAGDAAAQAWLADALAALAPGGTQVVVDQSHRPQPSAAVAAAWVVRATSESPARWALAGGAALVAAALLFLASPLSPWGPHRHDANRFRSRREARGAGATGSVDPEAAKPARRSWTRRAAGVGAAAAILLLAGAVTRSATALSAGALLAAPLFVAAFGRPPALTVGRSLGADRVPEGQEVAVQLEITARRGGDLELRDGVPAEDEVIGRGPWRRVLVRRNQRLALDYQVRPALRGPHTIGPLRVRASDPFRLCAWDVPAGEAADLQVLPRRDFLKRVRLPVRRPDLLMGANPVNRAGEGSEFQALREYQNGDALRMVNWKASARSKTLMVNLRVHESQTIFTLLLDARAVSDCGPAKTTPLACSARAALTMAAAAAQGRDRIRFASFGADLAEIPPAPAQRFLHLVADHLSAVHAAGDMRFSDVAARMLPAIKPGTPVALFSGLEGDAGFGAGARTLVGRGASLTVFAFPIATVDAAGNREPEADAIEARRAQNVKDMRSAGAHVYELKADLPLEPQLRLQGVSR